MLQQTNGEALTKTGQLPRTMKDRDAYVGVKVTRTGQDGRYFRAVFTVSKTLLAEIGNPTRVAVRGTPENGYLITAGKEIKPSLTGRALKGYLYVTADRANVKHAERDNVWMRAETEAGKRIRVPSLPPDWIAGKPQAGAIYEEGSKTMTVSKVAGDDPVRSEPSQAKALNGGNGVSPLPKASVGYQLPAGVDLNGVQALLATKLDEARVIIRELEKRTGLRFTLTRNFVLVLDLGGR